MEKIKLLTRISYLLVTILYGLFAYEHIYRVYQLETNLVNQSLSSSLEVLKEDLRQEVINAKASLSLMENVINLRIDRRILLNEANLLPVMTPLLASRQHQHNLYFALEPAYSKLMFKQEGVIFFVHQNEQLEDFKSWNDVNSFKVNIFTNPDYLKNSVWYQAGKKSQEVVATSVSYDRSPLALGLFSFVKGVFQDGKLRGVVAVDFSIDGIVNKMSGQMRKMHGGLALIDNQTGEIFIPPGQGKDFDFKSLKKRFMGKDLQNKSYESEAGEKLLVNSYLLKDLNRSLVTVTSQDYIYAEVFSKVYFLLLLFFIVLIFNLLVVYFFFRYLNRSYFDIVTQNQSSGIVRLTEGLCHEINNPLATLNLCQGAMKRLLKNEIQNSALNGLMTKSEKAADRIKIIIQKLQSISFATSEVEFKASSVADIVEELKMIFSEDLTKYKISFTLNASEGGIIVCDPLKMLQVFMPLMENSIEEIKSLENRWIRIEIEKTKAGHSILFVDSGHGVKQGVQERIFLPFFTTKVKDMKKGLGLTVAKSLIEQQGGTISYLEFAKNTTFKILLPFMPQVRN